MIKITIEGPQGSGKTRIAKAIATWARKNMRSPSGALYLSSIKRDSERITHADKECYDIIIVEKQR